MRPMKPYAITEADLDTLRYPYILQPKYDGIRALIVDGQVLSGQLKPIPNKHIQKTLAQQYDWLGTVVMDGELILRDTMNFQAVQAAVMSKEGKPNFQYVPFDNFLRNSLSLPYAQRNPAFCGCVVRNKEEVLTYETSMLNMGFEGIILRHPNSPYKYGRSTFKEGWLLKFKRFADAEAVVKYMVPLEMNLNPQEVDERGLTRRSSAADGKIEAAMLGALVCVGTNGRFSGVTFRIGSGFTEAQRTEWWKQADTLVGKTLTYKYQEVGSADAPRCPIFKAWREDI